MYDEPEQANVTVAGLRANEDVFPASEGGYVDLWLVHGGAGGHGYYVREPRADHRSQPHASCC